MPRRGALIVIEGINGSGKTTLINELKKHFHSIRVPASFYKFPDRSGIQGEKIDKYLKGEIKIESKYDILDMFAANRDAVRKNIDADLKSGNVVICDRYIFSAIAYQIPAHVTDFKNIHNYCNIIGYFDKCMPIPDMIYLIDGDHLHKRGIAPREIFHCTGVTARSIKHKLYAVIKNYTNRFEILKNYTGRINELVNFIAYDIDVDIRSG